MRTTLVEKVFDQVAVSDDGSGHRVAFVERPAKSQVTISSLLTDPSLRQDLPRPGLVHLAGLVYLAGLVHVECR